jgi:hypothetical protein
MENIMDFMIYILSPVISLDDFDLVFGLCLNQGFEIFEVLKDLINFPKKVDPSKCEKSSTKMRKNLSLLMDGCRKGPIRSLWIIYKGAKSH